MFGFANKRKRNFLIIIASVLLIIALLVIGCAIYLSDYYRSDEAAIEAYLSDLEADFSTTADGLIAFSPEGADTGLIFYPGGKVEYTAYLPLMAACAEEGILCVLVEMPFHLAVLDVSAAEGIQEMYPEIEHWYIGGHSLGGSMAASYLADHVDSYEGLILLGSYSTADLSDTDLSVLSIYGSEDGVLNREKYAQYQSNLPEDFTEVILEGGCHAGFGMYGEQDGDGLPTLSTKEQIRQTAEKIAELSLH